MKANGFLPSTRIRPKRKFTLFGTKARPTSRFSLSSTKARPDGGRPPRKARCTKAITGARAVVDL